jgi:hypothetical protein
MIVQFSDSNFGVFTKGFELSFVSTENVDRRKEPSVIRRYGQGPEPLRFPLEDTDHGILPLAGVWGAEGENKSLLIQTLRDITHIAKGGEVKYLTRTRKQRRLGIVFAEKGEVFEFQITLAKGRVVSESLRKGSNYLYECTSRPAQDVSLLAEYPEISHLLLRSYHIVDFNRYYAGVWTFSKDCRKLLLTLGDQANMDTRTWPAIFDGTAEDVPAFTWTFICLALRVLDALKNGYMLVVEGLDAELHTDVCIELIRAFTESSNKTQAQLCFTARHETIMDYLRRDETYIVDRKRTGPASLYAVSDFALPDPLKVRKTSVLYTEGRLGGLPCVGRMYDCFEEHLS